MGVSFNLVTIAGGITRDPELRHIGSGTAVCELSVAVSEKPKDKPEKTHYFEVVCWGRTAEIAAEYLRRGSPCLIGGRLDHQTWEKDGKKRSAVKIVCDRLQLLGSKPEGNQSGGSRRPPQSSGSNQGGRNDDQQGGGYDDDVPFAAVDWRALG